MTRTFRTWLSDTLFDLAVRLAPRAQAAALAPVEIPKLAATPWPPVTITHLRAVAAEPAIVLEDPPLPELSYVADPNQRRAAEKLRVMANDVEIGMVRSFHAVWHGGPCELHAFVELPPNAGDA